MATLQVDMIALVHVLHNFAYARISVVPAGKEYESRLRQQHAKLNPKTSWARFDQKKLKRRRGFGDDSDEE